MHTSLIQTSVTILKSSAELLGDKYVYFPVAQDHVMTKSQSQLSRFFYYDSEWSQTETMYSLPDIVVNML